MKLRKYIFYLLLASLCGLVGGTLYQIRQTTILRAQKADCIRKNSLLHEALAEAQDEKKELHLKLQDASKELQKLETSIETSKATAAEPAGTALATAEAKKASFQLGPVQDAELLATNPEYKKLWIRYQRWCDRMSFTRMYQKLGLTSAQILAFEDLLLQRSQIAVDIAEAALERDTQVDTAGYNKLARPAYTEMETQIKQLLGDEGYQEYRLQCRNIGGKEARATIQAMVNGLFHSDTPLTVEQADRLTRIIDASYMQTGNEKVIDWNKVFSTAQPVLAPEQIELLRRLQNTSDLDKQMAALAASIARRQN